MSKNKELLEIIENCATKLIDHIEADIEDLRLASDSKRRSIAKELGMSLEKLTRLVTLTGSFKIEDKETIESLTKADQDILYRFMKRKMRDGGGYAKQGR